MKIANSWHELLFGLIALALAAVFIHDIYIENHQCVKMETYIVAYAKCATDFKCTSTLKQYEDYRYAVRNYARHCVNPEYQLMGAQD